MSAELEIKGLRPLLKKLDRMPAALQRKALRPAVMAAATPIVKAARREAPRGAGLTPEGKKRLHLYKTIDKRVKTYARSGTVVAVIGSRSRTAPHASLVHSGTKSHVIGAGGKLLAIGGRLIRGPVTHPGAKPNAYLKRALESTKGASLAALKTRLAASIEKVLARA